MEGPTPCDRPAGGWVLRGTDIVSCMQESFEKICARCPDVITLSRIASSILMLIVPGFSTEFFIIYAIGGASDVLDGYVARRFDLSTEFGSRFDTFADICFFCSTLAVIAASYKIPVWLFIWVVVLASMKALCSVYSIIVSKRISVSHTTMNRIAGLLLFALPLAIIRFEFVPCATIVAFAATASSLHCSLLTVKNNVCRQMTPHDRFRIFRRTSFNVSHPFR